MRKITKAQMESEVEICGLNGWEDADDFDLYRFGWWDEMRMKEFIFV